MALSFNDAVAAGAKVRTVTGPDTHFGVSKGEYVQVAFHRGRILKDDVKVGQPPALAVLSIHERRSS